MYTRCIQPNIYMKNRLCMGLCNSGLNSKSDVQLLWTKKTKLLQQMLNYFIGTVCAIYFGANLCDNTNHLHKNQS